MRIPSFVLVLAQLAGLAVSSAAGPWTALRSPERKLPSNVVKALAVDGHRLFAATDQGVVCLSLTKDSAGLLDVARLPRGMVNDLEICGDSLFIAGNGGISIYHLRRNELVLLPPERTGIQNAVKAVSGGPDEIWFATDGGGAFVLDRASGEWRRFSRNSGLLSDNLRAVLLDNDTVWFGTNNQGLSLLSRRTEGWGRLDRYDGLSNNNVTAIARRLGKVYIATYHGLTVYDHKTDDVLVVGKEQGLHDDMLLSLALDGRYLWLGGMGGISRYDTETGKVAAFGSAEGAPEDFVNALAPYGGALYAATDGRGIAILDKGFPSVRLDRAEFRGREVSLWGAALGRSGGGTLAFSCFNPAAPAVRFNQGFKLPGARTGVLGVWDLSGVMDGAWVVELTVTDPSGADNTAVIEVATDTFDPELALSEPPAFTNRKTLSLSGSFREKNTARILLFPGPVTAALDISRRTFAGNVVLTPGRNTVRAVIFDRSGRSMEAKRTVFFSDREARIEVTDAPAVTREGRIFVSGRVESEVPVREIVLFPGSQPVALDAARTFRIPITLSQPGENLLLLKVTDACGNTASRTVAVLLDNAGPQIRLDPVPAFTSDSSVRVSGTVTDPSLHEAALLPGGAAIPFDSSSGRFTFQRKLREGRNHFLVTAADRLGNASQVPIDVVRDGVRPRLAPPEVPAQIRDPGFVLTGRYDEDHIARVWAEPGPVEAVLDTVASSYALRLKLTAGDNLFTLKAVDKAGNAAQLAITLNARFDAAGQTLESLRERVRDLERMVDSLRKTERRKP